MIQYLSAEGRLVKKNLPKITNDRLIKIYETMVLTRIFDDLALKLQREGRILTFASLKGQEASQIASSFVLKEEDWVVPTYRDHGVLISKGVPLHKLYLYYAGDERGMSLPQNINALPPAIPIGSHIPHAVGIAWAQKLQKKSSVVMVYFGDGATSKGDFHEGINFAAVFKVPCVFVCQNNQWAISVPFSRQTASESIAEKAISYGIEGVLVDGNDVFAVYEAAKKAVDKARKGKGPTLIECYTYRIESHTTADDWQRYRDKKEVELWKKRDPIKRFSAYLKSKRILDDKKEKEIINRCENLVNEEIKRFEATPFPKREEMFNFQL
jgi:pyruvate dehydrogenase E1 component alpha subunit